MKFKMAATAGLSLTLDLKPSWISDRHKKPKLFRGPSNDYSWAVWFHLSKWFKRRSVLKHFSHREINIGPYGKMFKCLLKNYKYD
jgi:hypothetical protein